MNYTIFIIQHRAQLFSLFDSLDNNFSNQLILIDMVSSVFDTITLDLLIRMLSNIGFAV